MLLRFEVANHRSIREPVELTMIAVDDDRQATRGFERLKDRVLTVAAFYGANASGKSNVLDSLGWLSHAVQHSLRMWDESIPREPHAFHGVPAQPTTFGLDLMVGEVRYAYELSISDTEVLSESLYSYPRGRARRVFDRQGSTITFRSGIAHNAIRELLTPTTLILSAGIRMRTDELAEVGRAIANIQYLGLPKRGGRYPALGMGPSPFSTTRIFSQWDDFLDNPERVDNVTEHPMREAALGLLRFADLGIEDVEVPPRPNRSDPDERHPRTELKLIHNVGNEFIPLDFSEESEGTRVWYQLISPLLNVLRTGEILLFDEMDASLHPHLTAKIVDLFYDEKTNPHNAQLIFTTHDTNLLLQLNRDEIWLTEKDNQGATTLTALAEFSGDTVRRSMNLERNYLQGRYGGLPHLDESQLLPAQLLVGNNE